MFKKSSARLKICLTISVIFLLFVVNPLIVFAGESEDIFIGSVNIKLGDLPAPLLLDSTAIGVKGIRSTIHVEIFGKAEKVWVVSDDTNFELQYDPISRLWFGFINAENEGMYNLDVFAKDTEDKVISKKINSIYFYNSGKILVDDELNTTPSTVALYYRKDAESSWSMWNASELGQKNPIFTEESGEYSYFVGKGEYFLSVSKDGYRTRKSTIFRAEEGSVINSDIYLQPSGLFDFFISIFDSFEIDAKEISSIPVESEDKTFENNLEILKLKDAKQTLPLGSILDSKPGIVSFWSMWGLQSPEQIYQISRLADDEEVKDYQILSVGLSEDYSSLNKIVQKGSYIINLFALENYRELDKWGLITSPYYIFLDKEGVPVKVVEGRVLSSEEIKLMLLEIK